MTTNVPMTELYTYHILFKTLSKEERTKMELWAMAQIDYIENQNLNNLTFEVIQKSGTNPIFQSHTTSNVKKHAKPCFI